MNHTCFALLPRDGVSSKDGRGWYTSEVGRGHSHPWPPPTTVRGALRAAWGHHLMASTGQPLRPDEWERRSEGLTLRRWLALRRPLGESFQRHHRVWPVPADARIFREGDHLRVERLEPRPTPNGVATLGPDEDDAREALWYPWAPRGKPLPSPLFWTETDMEAWLRSEPLTYRPVEDPARRLDLHLAIDASTQTAQPSMLHALEVVEMLGREPARGPGLPPRIMEWALGLECNLPEEAPGFPGGPVGLGSRRKLTEAERLTPEVFGPPARLPETTPGLRLVLATPAQFQRGWLPDGFSREEGAPQYVGRLPGVEAEVVLRAALVPRPMDISVLMVTRKRGFLDRVALSSLFPVVVAPGQQRRRSLQTRHGTSYGPADA
ncbi:MAG: type III-B CRISPR module-associated Cmr3 family protein, partial [Archangium sp.]